MSSSTASDPDQPPTQGLVAGKYEIVRLIGRGGMGSVWEARHNSLGTKVAIKFVEVEQAQSAEARERFQNEARAAATIQSKHAIKVYDHGLLDDGRPYIVMEMLVGEPLDSRVSLLGRLPIQETARMVLQVARALQQAHDAGITHRDLKPENIFLVKNPDDDEEIAKVLDFGIAKVTQSSHALAVSSSTKTGVLMGTPYYMSPEQARGLKTLDFRSDLWALGVIVFRCVTGSLPFTGEALGDLLVKICASPVPVPSTLVPGLTPQFDAWMAKALQREPQDRFQSAHEMAESFAMVAGISVRVTSRRSYDAAPASIVVTPAPQYTPSGGNAGAFAGTQEVMSRPIPVVTSSPLTASAHPPPTSKGFSASTVVGLAIGGVAVALGIYFAVLQTQKTHVQVDTAAAASIAPAAPTTPAPAPTQTASAAATASVATPPVAAAAPSSPSTAEPSKGSTSGHGSRHSAAPPPAVAAAPLAAPAAPLPPVQQVAAPTPPTPRPPRPAGNDPGF